ncbi:Myelin-oligodendrocyte glycoprotein Precursor [Channa argus]|uniref:Myelin-oligodendrocyte glycoprotein n=1 Tax=Channa argus TaxID=215402 RepID=A0A6G1Q732_CHAAH|nr:Myelin-oligodendrocyte glycoprotein Precursor [Channa argus]
MASVDMFFLSYSLYFLILFPLSTAFEVKEIKATSGEDVFLPCLSPKDSSITLLEWIRPDLKSDGYVFFYRNNRSYENYQHPAFHGRVKLRDKSSVKNGDVSLVLKNVSNSDSGIYECQILISNTGASERTNIELKDLIRLTVTQSGGGAEHILKERMKDGGNKNQYHAFVLSVSVITVCWYLCREV